MSDSFLNDISFHSYRMSGYNTVLLYFDLPTEYLAHFYISPSKPAVGARIRIEYPCDNKQAEYAVTEMAVLVEDRFSNIILDITNHEPWHYISLSEDIVTELIRVGETHIPS